MNTDTQTDTWAVDLANFSGPLDVLLHLIQTQDIDIFDIPIANITEQYIELIHANPLEELTLAGDYLVMAATLIEIKTKLLLPKPQKAIEEDVDDPRRSLVEQLLAYQQYKELSGVLQTKHEKRMAHYERPTADLTQYQQTIPLNEGEITTEDMMVALQKMIQRLRTDNTPPRTIQNDAYSVDEAIWDIESSLKRTPKQELSLFQLTKQRAWTRNTIVTLFLALLQLVKGNAITIAQDNAYSDIRIVSRTEGLSV